MMDFIEDFSSSGTDCVTIIVNDHDELLKLHPGRWEIGNVIKFCKDQLPAFDLSEWTEAFTRAAQIINDATKTVTSNKNCNTKING